MLKQILATGAALALLGACGGSDPAAPVAPEQETSAAIVELAAGEDLPARLQAALIEAKTGETIMMPEGTYALSDGLSLDVDGVHLKGAGQGKTVLNFAGQTGAGEGLLVTSDNVILSDFTMQDTKGDGIKSKGADQIIYRDLTVEWTRGPDPSNGAYAIYPVESENVLVERTTVRGASDAGIYVGQSSNIIVRNNTVEQNVAGIEIENSTHADVFQNTATNNTAGILVFDLPDLPVMGGHSTRIFDNTITNNNVANFAPPGNIVGEVPAGTGVIVMANRNVHVFDNQLDDHKSAHIIVSAYEGTWEDKSYNPLPREVVIHGNTYGKGGYAPDKFVAEIHAQLQGLDVPPILWDGVTDFDGNPGDQPPALSIKEPSDIGYLSVGIGKHPADLEKLMPSALRPEPFDVAEPQPVVLPHDKSS